MTTVNMTIQLRLDEAEVPAFKGADLFVTPHKAWERPAVLSSLAVLERFVEASGDAEAITAFQVLGGFFARSKVTEARRVDA